MLGGSQAAVATIFRDHTRWEKHLTQEGLAGIPTLADFAS